MEKIDIVCIGTLKESYMSQLCDEYIKRLKRFCDLKVIELPESRLAKTPGSAQIERALDTEYLRMLPYAVEGAFKIAMCIEGRSMSSQALAQSLEQCMLSQGKAVIFIGSSYGLSQKLKDCCDLRLSMSCMTFPHQLARCMLLEQIYRSYKIRRNETYHK